VVAVDLRLPPGQKDSNDDKGEGQHRQSQPADRARQGSRTEAGNDVWVLLSCRALQLAILALCLLSIGCSSNWHRCCGVRTDNEAVPSDCEPWQPLGSVGAAWQVICCCHCYCSMHADKSHSSNQHACDTFVRSRGVHCTLAAQQPCGLYDISIACASPWLMPI
jgi:hypothetical protein